MALTERYADVKAHAPAGPRGLLRHAALSALALRDRALGAERALRAPRVQFLYIHHTFTDELPALRALLADLARTHRFLSYSEAVERVLQARIDEPCIAISSDDGFRNNLEGGRILRDHGISACFFVNPGLIGLRDPERIRRICAERLHFPPVAFLDWKEAEQLKAMGHEIGSHSWEHRRLSTLSPAELADDIARSRSLLIARLGEAPHFAYPYGRFADLPRAGFQAVFDAGHRSCASAERGCHVPAAPVDPRALLIRRDHIILDWPLAHIRYFLAASARRADATANGYPAAA